MKKSQWTLWLCITAVCVALRGAEVRFFWDENGFPTLFSWILPVCFVLALICFLCGAKALPHTDNAALPDRFDFSGKLPLGIALLGCVSLIVSAVLAYLAREGIFAYIIPVVGALSVLYVLFFLRGGECDKSRGLLIPVCALAVQLIFTYRADGVDPVLVHHYIQILALAALLAAFLQLAAFAYCSGKPRTFLPLSEMAVLFALCAAAEQNGKVALFLFLGWALLLLAFLAAYRPQENAKA